MSESWNDHAGDWDNNPDVIKYAKQAYNSLIDHIDPNGLTVMDFGCGTGQLTEKLSLSGADVTAVDPAQKMVDVVKQKKLNNVVTLCSEITEEVLSIHPQWFQNFDLIVASSVFSFVPDYTETLSLLSKLLKPEGLIVQWDWKKHEDFGFDHKMIHAAHKYAALTTLKTDVAFSFSNQKGKMDVIMGIGQKT